MKRTYLKYVDIHVIEYAGTVTYDEGLLNMEIIENEIRKVSAHRDCIKIIFDVRNTVWKSRETHDELSGIARRIFDPGNFDCTIFTVVLNDELDGPTFENEHWCVKKEDAIAWLAQRTRPR